jgi:nicotinate-nucleotide--dimethylbenzimidazole phosphoribosyltransferase
VTIRSLDDIRALLRELPGPDNAAAERTRQREATLTKPPGALGRLEHIAEWLSAWQGRHPPAADRALMAVFAGSHGVVAEGVSAFPAAVTAQMVENFRRGGAAINQLCSVQGCALKVFDVGVGFPTRNFLDGPAMTGSECAEAFATGMAALDEDTDVVCVGEMGIGNTTTAAALSHALHGGAADEWTGPGTGVTGATFENKIRVVRAAVTFHAPDVRDGLDALQRLGGRELAAMAGAIVAARLAKVPVILDGYVCCAAAAALEACQKGALDHCLAGHLSAEPAHRRLLTHLGKVPLLDLGMRLGEGSGAAVALAVVRSAVACHTGMATFAEAGVSDREEP